MPDPMMSANSQARNFAMGAISAGADSAEIELIELKSSFDDLTESVEKSGKAAGRTLDTMAGLGALASVMGQLANAINRVTDSVVRGLADASKAAIDFIEDAERISNIFDRQGDAAARLGEKIAASYGLARDEGARVLANTSDLLVGFGFTEKQALQLSESIIKLGGDLTSFRNMEEGVVGATESLSAGILGNRRNLRRLGIIVRMTDEDYRAAEDTFRRVNGFGERQAQILATLKLAYDQSRKALGDFARTQDQAANRMRIFNSAVRELKLELGLAVVEGFALNEILATMTAVVRSALKWWSETSREFKITAIAIAALVTGALAAISTILALASVLAVAGIALTALGGAAATFAVIVGGLVSAVAFSTLAFAGLILLLGEGETFSERFASGLGKIGEMLSYLVGLLLNFSMNLAIWQSNVGRTFEFVTDQMIGWWEVINGVITDGVANAIIELGNMVTAFENVPRAIAAAMTLGPEAGRRELLRGMDEMIDTVGNAAERMAPLLAAELDLQAFVTDFDIGDIPILAGLDDILADLRGEGPGAAEFQAPSAIVEGSVEAANIIAETAGGRGNPEERAAAATESTAAAANMIAAMVSDIAGDGVNLKNASPA